MNEPIKFGLAQRNNPTPKRINDFFDLLSAVLGIITAFLSSAAFIPHGTSDIITPIVTGLLIPLCPVFKRYFGVEVDSARVPTENVTVINDEK